ncbi:hypothetical protein [Rhodococcus sp. SGAir0479]|uniref:hypothetical protein n=1 Tax=Rhodococcus sp. SGAir0479 TaxID=2567884 RepID=UPI0010CCC615|nr:hypothetical protein [Rhodococcus sp. SGAir0479]QCQ92606.1 hypothetical protein E7742_16200 [Rhodococcus sp. SGAir0479]
MRGKWRAAAGAVAAAAMVTGLAWTGAGTAVAADRYEGPTLETTQGDFGGKNLELKLTNPKKAEGFFSESMCTSALLDGQQGLDAFVAFNAKDYGKLISIMASPGLRVGPAAGNNFTRPGPNSDTRTVQVNEGVYIFLGTCGGWESVLDPSNVGVSMQLVIVPDGIGSVSPALAFGSTALDAGVDLASLLPMLGSLAGAAGGGS